MPADGTDAVIWSLAPATVLALAVRTLTNTHGGESPVSAIEVLFLSEVKMSTRASEKAKERGVGTTLMYYASPRGE